MKKQKPLDYLMFLVFSLSWELFVGFSVLNNKLVSNELSANPRGAALAV